MVRTNNHKPAADSMQKASPLILAGQQVLVDWNDTRAEYPDNAHIGELFAAQAKRTPEALAVMFEHEQLTYSELNRRANQLAHYLQALGVRPGVLVGLCVERSLDLIVGLLGILKAGGAYLPLDPIYPSERLAFMMEDTAAPVLVTQQRLLTRFVPEGVYVVCLDSSAAELARHSANDPTAHAIADDLAYVIYTSGSTGRPKGVQISHRSLCNLVFWHQRAFAVTSSDRATQLASPAFDAAGWELWPYLTIGASVHLLDEETRVSPTPLRDWLLSHAITITFLPTPLAESMMTLEWPTTTTLRYMLTGGDTLHHYSPTHLPFVLINNYGPTEATVVATCGPVPPVESPHSGRLPAIGRPIANTQIYLLDEHLQPVPVGIAGELHIGGAGVAQGYLNRPELTAERFIPNPFSAEPGARLYKTGDRARYLDDGNIEFLGRLDTQVKLRGFRIELGEIEAVLTQHPAVRESVVLIHETTRGTGAVEERGDQRLVAYVVPHPEKVPTSAELHRYLQEHLPAYMMPSAFVVLETFPLTPNGKLDRRALPAPELTETYVAPGSPVQDILAGIWAEIFGLERVGIHDDFFELGGHSLLATQLISRLREAFQVELPLRSVFEASTVADLAKIIDTSRRKEQNQQISPIRPIPRDGPLPLSFSQERVWFVQQLDAANISYNFQATLRFRGVLDVMALERSLGEIVQRHEILRTTFPGIDGHPVQLIHPSWPVNLPVIDLQAQPENEREAAAQRLINEELQKPFDLTKLPLIRWTLFRLGEQEHVLLHVEHHLIHDGWSFNVLLRELLELYQVFCTGKPSPLPNLPIQFADFAHWQRQWLEGEVAETQLAYWKKRLSGSPPVLELPSDRPRPAVQTFRGAAPRVELPSSLCESLRTLSRQEGVTLFMTMLAAFLTLLYRYSGQEDICIGSGIANRRWRETEGLIGMIINTLVLRTDLSGGPTFRQLLRRVREVALEAYVYQDIPFDKLVEALRPERNLSYNPLFQVTFSFHDAPLPNLNLPGLTIDLHEGLDNGSAKFDLNVVLIPRSARDTQLYPGADLAYDARDGEEYANGMTLVWEYNSDLFDASSIDRMLEHFQTLLEGVVTNPEQRLKDLPLMTQAERQQVLKAWNDTEVTYPKNTCIHELFEAQVEKTPNAIAVMFEDEQLTYRELDVRANQLARDLRSLGVGPESRVGLCMQRSLELVVGVLGILKAGGAYVPLDPTYPAKRLAFMLQDARVEAMVTQHELVSRLPAQSRQVVFLDIEWRAIGQEEQERLISGVQAENLAYVIYTSGSMGWPKGVLVTHENVVHSTLARLAYYHEPVTGYLLLSSFAFDSSVAGIFWTLCQGGMLVFPQQGFEGDPLYIAELIAEKQVSHILSVPSLYGLLLTQAKPQQLTSLQTVIVAGEPCPGSLPAAHSELLPQASFFNEYGPTEATVWSSVYQIRLRESGIRVPIGRPIANTQIYVLDADQQPVPMGVPGELYIGGAGVARGYLNRAELTAERFVPNPFSSEPGARLYKTGDLARYLPDGIIDFLGRIDRQVKLRGFRIEPEEIEVQLDQHPAVRESIVIAQEDQPDHKYLVAYVVPNAQYEQMSEVSRESEHISQYQVVYDQLYSQSQAFSGQDPAINSSIWTSSYTSQPLSEEEILESVNDTVKRVLTLQPDRVLEIGCGTGLLLFRIAPHCTHYCGVDISEIALSRLRMQLAMREPRLANVALYQRAAHDAVGVESDPYDTVLLNEVVQHFPSIDYFVRVLENLLMNVVKPGGSIFIGGLRSLPLLKTFHTSVQLYRASSSLSITQLQQRIQEHLFSEKELVIDPAFFTALQQYLPQISSVQIQLKGGRHDNEMTRFKYDVLLHVGTAIGATADLAWLDWRQQGLTVSSTRDYLRETEPARLGIKGVPNARLLADVKAAQLLVERQGELKSVGDLREALLYETSQEGGVDPEDLWDLSRDLSYAIDIRWSNSGTEGFLDVLFRREAAREISWRIVPSFPGEATRRKPWHDYANNPLQARFSQNLVPQLRRYLQERLPEYMLPTFIVLLQVLPLTPNGKVDRRMLPAPGRKHPELEGEYIAPRNLVEEVLVQIWAQVLGIEQVGIRDNFFEVGGHSLLGTQVISRLRDLFQVELPLRSLFEAPTVAALAARIEAVHRDRQGTHIPPIARASRAGELQLSFAQQRLWFLDQWERGSSFYNMPIALLLTGQLDIAVLERSLNEIVRRHEALRTTFMAVEGRPVQVIAPVLTVPLPVVDLSRLPGSEQEAEKQRVANAEAQQPFDLSCGPLIRTTLLRLAEEAHVLLLTLHHSVFDGWSVGLLFRELAALYDAYASGEPSPLPELPIQYADFALWQREWLQGEVLEIQMAYWRRQLEGISVLALPTDRPRPAIQTYKGARFTFVFPKELSEELKALSRREGVTLFMTLLAAFMALLSRYSGQDDLVVGSPIANRTNTQSEGLIGCFFNTLVLRCKLSGSLTFRELLGQVRETTLGAYAHQDLPFEKLVEELQPERSLSYAPLFQVVFAFQNVPMQMPKLPGITLGRVEPESSTARLDLLLSLVDEEQGLRGVLEYNTDLFDTTTIARMKGHYHRLLEGIVADPGQCLRALPLLTEAERQQQFAEWNATQTDYPRDACVQELFEAQVARTPEAVAVACEGEQLTYRELNRLANRLAHHLRVLGVGPDVLVALLAERGCDLLTAILAVLKAGGAYLPLDPLHPVTRLRQVLERSSTRLVLATDEFSSALDQVLEHMLPGSRPQVLSLEALLQQDQGEENLPAIATQGHLAYVIYTSGSTGIPKGVMIEHGGMLNHLYAKIKDLDLTGADIVAQTASQCFDISVWQFFAALLVGGRVRIFPDSVAHDPVQLLARVEEYSVTVLETVPSLLRAMLEVLDPAEAGRPGLAALRWLIPTGEALAPDLCRRWLTFYPRIPLLNAYGPTECSDDVTHFPIFQPPAAMVTHTPIGRPVANMQLYVLDEMLEPLPVGVYGELYVGGIGVGRGYLHDPSRTAESFIPDPFGSEPGARLYKTGDVARYLPDGSIEYIGRVDHQVKIRGFRIELGEIEFVLNQHPAVQEAVVVAREDMRLAAYLVLQPDQNVASQDLRSFLKEQLPEYMVPSVFMELEALPLTTNGKVDRQALPAPGGERSELVQGYAAPRTWVEEELAEIWATVLKLSLVGVHDNFFEVGGHSLLATQVISRVRRAFQVDLPLRSLFETPTVAGLAETIMQKTFEQEDNEVLAQLLAGLDEADGEVQAMPVSRKSVAREGEPND